ncbi:MAG: GNAT family N-acetyltransferase [Desulfobacterales bacterium]|jgi:GNAT superfamily N-acetyltransferase
MPEIKIQGYYPGVVGKITELHAVYYHEHWGFNVSFETQVGRELSIFVSKFDAHRDGLWVATADGKFAGAVAIDGDHAMTDGARLRWFIVDPKFQGVGLGSRLIALAVKFCKEKGYPKIFLWTFEGLDPARRLYERHDFQLREAHEVEQWGQTIMEQKFELLLQGSR